MQAARNHLTRPACAMNCITAGCNTLYTYRKRDTCVPNTLRSCYFILFTRLSTRSHEAKTNLTCPAIQVPNQEQVATGSHTNPEPHGAEVQVEHEGGFQDSQLCIQTVRPFQTFQLINPLIPDKPVQYVTMLNT